MYSSEWLEEQTRNIPRFRRAHQYVIDRGIIDLDPWYLFTSEEQLRTRTNGINSRYPYRSPLSFAERQDTDDVGCVVTRSDGQYEAGTIIIVHDFASSGSEVDAVFQEFWGWFKAAIEDMIDTYTRI